MRIVDYYMNLEHAITGDGSEATDMVDLFLPPPFGVLERLSNNLEGFLV